MILTSLILRCHSEKSLSGMCATRVSCTCGRCSHKTCNKTDQRHILWRTRFHHQQVPIVPMFACDVCMASKQVRNGITVRHERCLCRTVLWVWTSHAVVSWDINDKSLRLEVDSHVKAHAKWSYSLLTLPKLWHNFHILRASHRVASLYFNDIYFVVLNFSSEISPTVD